MFASLLSQDLKIATMIQEPHMLQSKVIRMSPLSVNIQENTIQNHKLSNIWKKYVQLQNNSSYLSQN